MSSEPTVEVASARKRPPSSEEFQEEAQRKDMSQPTGEPTSAALVAGTPAKRLTTPKRGTVSLSTSVVQSTSLTPLIKDCFVIQESQVETKQIGGS